MPKVVQQYTHRKNPRIYLQERSNSKFLQAVTFLNGKKHQKSMKTAQLNTAEKLSEEWFKLLKQTVRNEKIERLGEVPTMGQLYDSWATESMAPKKLAWIQMKWSPIKPFWRTIRVTDINAQTFKEFYRWRRTGTTRKGTKITNHTLHKDVIFLRQLLKYAREEEHIDVLPAIPKVGSIEPNPRPWLTRQEWDHLYQVSQQRVDEADGNPRLQQQRVDLDDQMVWMISTMMRVGEAFPANGGATPIRFRDCRVEKNSAGDKVLICEVQGKRGGRTVVGRSEAVEVYKRRLKQADEPSPNAFIFPVHHREALTELLKAAKLHIDPRRGFERNFKSLRATAISFAVLRGTDLLMIARNAGTSVTMIDQFYSRRLSAEMGKDTLTARRVRTSDE